MEKFVIIDGNNILFRSYYALPRLANVDGVVSNGVFGFCNILVKIITDLKPKYIAVAFDSAKKNFRHEMFAEYKAGRAPAPDELINQLPIIKQVLKAMGVTVVEQKNLEADDLIGCLSKQFVTTENIILTADKDCLQLIDKNTKIMQPHKGVTETVILDEAGLMEKMGLTPRQIIDFKGLAGDQSDNIPGVKGVGEKTAVGLLQKYGTVEGIYNNIDEIAGKLREKLESDRENAFMSKKLATIVTDERMNFELTDFEYSFPFNKEVLDLFRKYQFNSLLRRSELFREVEQESAVIKEVKTEDDFGSFADILTAQKEVAFYLDCDALNVSFGKKEYKICFSKTLLDDGLDYQKSLIRLKPFFENANIQKIVFDCKKTKHVLGEFNIALNGVSFDCMVARYVVNSNGNNNVTLQNVMDENLFNNDAIAINLFTLRNHYLEKMEEKDTKGVFFDIEMPLIDILYKMEVAGVKIDEGELDVLKERYETMLSGLTDKIYALAGKQFNINSPKQLGQILFDDLKIEAWNNKKKSTNAQVLNDIQDKHPIVPLIQQYRLLNKLYTTYIVAYKEMAKNGKLYTVFNQTLTSTGRLSSSEPNLQNIPVRTEEGKNLRKIFVSSFENGKIVDADYNQIELRLLASFSGDEKLIASYNKGDDIHSITASEIFGVPLECVTPELRRKAKAINFGIVYGISDYGLSQNIGSSRKEAETYIKKYFEKYPKIKQYMDENVEFCKKHGYVRTMFGRIRYIPEISAENRITKQFGERASMNMPLQGSASDIIKLAMIGVGNELDRKQLKSKLILQVHDELVVDTHPDEVEQVKKILKDVMENVANLKVKLIVSIDVGDSWYDAH